MIPTYDLPTLYTNLDQYLTKAQHDLEKAIEAYGCAGEEHAHKHAEYREAKANAIKTLRDDKTPVTIIADLSQGMVAKIKAEEMAAEYRAKQCRMMVEAITERINILKHLSRMCAENAHAR